MSPVVKPRLLEMYKHYRFAVVFGAYPKPTLKHRLMVNLLDILHNPPRTPRRKDRMQ